MLTVRESDAYLLDILKANFPHTTAGEEVRFEDLVWTPSSSGTPSTGFLNGVYYDEQLGDQKTIIKHRNNWAIKGAFGSMGTNFSPNCFVALDVWNFLTRQIERFSARIGAYKGKSSHYPIVNFGRGFPAAETLIPIYVGFGAGQIFHDQLGMTHAPLVYI